jgi:hypothetical protein
MVKTLCFLTALSAGQVLERGDWQLSPQLVRGLELVYSGSYLDESLAPNVRYQKLYRLDTTLLVIEVGKQQCEVAVMTRLSQQDLPQQTGTAKTPPVSVRLELAKIDAQGRVRTSADKPLAVSVLGPTTLEFGFLAEVPVSRVVKGTSWDVNEDNYPVRTWQVIGTEACGGITCIKLVATQQSADWDQPRADTTAWRRKDVLWLDPQVNVARKVERTVERRDPAHQLPTHRAIVRYELESKLRYHGQIFEDRQREIAAQKRFQEEATPLFKQPAVYKNQIETLLKKVTFHIEHQPETPYRKAVDHLKQSLEGARRGETPVIQANHELPVIVQTVAVGQHVPDFLVGSLIDNQQVRYQKAAGRPTLLVFYNPATDLGRDVILFAKELSEKQANKVQVMALTLSASPEVAKKQHGALKLPFPVLDGQSLRITLSVEHTPRFVVIDGEGIMRWEATGWGFHVPAEINQALTQCQKR